MMDRTLSELALEYCNRRLAYMQAANEGQASLQFEVMLDAWESWMTAKKVEVQPPARSPYDGVDS